MLAVEVMRRLDLLHNNMGVGKATEETEAAINWELREVG